MANHADTKKRIRQNEKRRMRNRHFRSKMRNQIRALRAHVESGDVEAAKAQLPKTVAVIDRTAQKGIIHRKQAARKVSRLTNAVNKMGAAEQASA